ncbi:MFS transporter [Haloarculaceae archaeon H-GB2-1]|nr:MFS transporter [Haloarculaceae archaeon H-GB11]MEA5409193.1 MFS transporter [Haloarculaceae archaeon H-GB2-1]
MSRRHVFGSLCVMVFLVNLGRVVFAPLLEPLQVAFEVNAGAVGFVASAAWIGSALPRIPTGWLLTKYPRQHVILASGGVLTAASLLAPMANRIPTLAFGAFLMGLASGSYFIAANPLVSELFPDRVGRMMGTHGMSSQLGAVAASFIVIAALRVGTWRTTFYWMATAALLSTLLFAVLARRAELPSAGTADRALLEAIRAQWRIVLTGVLVVGATGFVWQGVFNFYDSYMIAKGLTQSQGQLLLSVLFAAGVPAFFIIGRLADRLPLVPLLLSVIGSFVLSILLLTVVEGLYAVVAVTLLVGFAIHGLFPAADTYLLASLPDRHRASAYAAYSASMMVIQAGEAGPSGRSPTCSSTTTSSSRGSRSDSPRSW